MNKAHPDTNPYEASQADLKPADYIPSFAPDKTIRARVVLTQEYLSEGLAHFRRQHPHTARNHRALRALGGLFLVLGVIVLLTTFFLGDTEGIVIALPLLALAGLTIMPELWMHRSLRRQHAKSPHRDEELEVTFSEDGLRATSVLQDSLLRWGVFTRVVECDEGVLLLQGENLVHWFPYSSLHDPRDTTIFANFLKSKLTAS